MSGSEPRLSIGAGPTQVPVPAPPIGLGHSPIDKSELPSSSTDSEQVSAGTSNSSPVYSSSEADEVELLPPLLSISELINDAPPWLFSAVIHMVAVIVLGLIFVMPESSNTFLLEFDSNDGLGEEISGEDFDVSLDTIDEELDSSFNPQELLSIEETELIETSEISPLLSDQMPITSVAPIQMSLTGRDKGMQQKLLDAYGGTGATQQAVMEGLRWLARNQGRKGLWSMQGKYSDGGSHENPDAATGLALIAFQGAGYTSKGDRDDPFTDVVTRAWKSLLKRQKDDGDFFNTGRGHAHLYTHAICTIALCELYGMTQASEYREPAQRAVDFCVKNQSKEGGWRYFPGTGSDLSVTGWFVMALQSARMAGLDVPPQTLARVSDYLSSCSREDGVFYAYQPASGATKSMTAEGLLCRQYLGWKQTDDRLQTGGNYIIRNLPEWDSDRDSYYWYYATQVCHHLEGQHWRTWNSVMRTLLPSTQEQEGKERGSWDPKGDAWANEGGRLYVTCLSIYMLEVYYRHLPIYQLQNLSHL